MLPLLYWHTGHKEKFHRKPTLCWRQKTFWWTFFFFALNFIFFLFLKHSLEQDEKCRHFLVSEPSFSRVLIKRMTSSKQSTSIQEPNKQCRNPVGEATTQQLLRLPTGVNNSRQHVQLLRENYTEWIDSEAWEIWYCQRKW